MASFSSLLLPPRLRAIILPMALAVLVFASAATAARYDLQVLNGDYNVPANWYDYTLEVSNVPTAADEAVVRNGGTLNITALDGNATAAIFRIGAGVLGANGVIAPADPAGPIPPAPPIGDGTLIWTGGDILGGAAGPQIRVGERNGNAGPDYTGTVTQSGGSVVLSPNSAVLTIGASGSTPTPTSSYTMNAGNISVQSGVNGNNGINVRNGTFTQNGGTITDVSAVGVFGQRGVTVSSASGPDNLTPNVAIANFTGGTLNVVGGMRIAANSRSSGYVNISGTANLWFRGDDFQLTNSTDNAYAEVNMSGGQLRVGDESVSREHRIIVGDRNVGVFNMSGGTVTTNKSLRVSNQATGDGTFYMTGGTLSAPDVEMQVDAIPNAVNETATIIIDGPSAVFNQLNIPSEAGSTRIGLNGRGRFEISDGQANLQSITFSQTINSRGTLNVFGGKLTVLDSANRTDGSAATEPVVNLTGGELEFNPAGTGFSWQADLNLQGTDFDPKPNARITTTVGLAGAPGVGRPADFSLNSGSVWDFNIVNGLIGGGDWVNVVNGTVALNGGLMNIIPIGGYVPTVGDVIRVARAPSAAQLTLSSNLQVSDYRWIPSVEVNGTEVHLTFVPEPTSLLLCGLGLSLAASIRRRGRNA